jgi:UDP-glucose 4-epimerase
MKQTAAVTGGAGFIGSHLVDLLLREGWNVRVLDNFSTGSPANLMNAAGRAEIIKGDIREIDSCRAACAGADSVFHLAAMASVADSVADPMLSHDVNLTGTLNLLTAARDAGVRRLVFSSSASIYGNADTVPTTEDQPYAPLSPYASQKAAGEFYCRNFFSLYGLETVILRYFNVFGPRQSANSGYAAAVPKFTQAAVTDAAPTVFGDGLQTRDFIYVENVASANLRAALAEGVAGKTFNVAGGNAVSLLDLLDELRQVTGAKLDPQFQEPRAGDVRHSRADVAHARKILGFAPAISFAEGIRRTIEGARSAGSFGQDKVLRAD